MPVEFNDEHEQQKASLLYAKFQSSAQLPRLEQWLIGKGIVKTPGQANMLLLGIAICALLAAGVIAFTMNRPQLDNLTPEQQRIEEISRNAGDF